MACEGGVAVAGERVAGAYLPAVGDLWVPIPQLGCKKKSECD